MSPPEYLHLAPASELPDVSKFRSFRAVLILEESVNPDWQRAVSQWLVDCGCLYMMAYGNDCSTWDDAVDYANIEAFNFSNIPEEKCVMTTWHSDEPLSEVFWFCKNNAYPPVVELRHTLIVHVANVARTSVLLQTYEDA